jgi:hypothetical protein
VKTAYRLFISLAVFYGIVDIIYWKVGGDPLGITGIFLAVCFASLLGFYFWFSDRRQGLLPEDNLEGEISDSAGELGFFSPHSWWPLPLGLSACAMGLGLVLGWWLTIIAVGSLFISILGFVLEYEGPVDSAPSHH